MPADEELELDPITESRTVAQTSTPDSEIVELPSTDDGPGALFDKTTGAAFPKPE